MDVLILAVLQAGIHFLGYDAVFFPDVGHVQQRPAGGKVHLAVIAYKALTLFIIRVPYGEHLAQVQRIASLSQNLVLEERSAGKTPACPRFVLVLDARGLDRVYVREFEALDTVSGHAVRVCRGIQRQHRQQCRPCEDCLYHCYYQYFMAQALRPSPIVIIPFALCPQNYAFFSNTANTKSITHHAIIRES